MVNVIIIRQTLYLLYKGAFVIKHLILALKGIAVGGANVVPGVSGATLAVIFRIYDKLIESINGLFQQPKKSLAFLVPLGIGMVIGIILIGSVIDVLLERFSLQTAGLIAGLMAGSIPFLYHLANRVPENAADAAPSKVSLWMTALLSAAIIIILSLLSARLTTDMTTDFNIGFVILLFIGGMFAAGTMIVPGVSGAMILILFGLYNLAMNTLSLIREYLMSPLDFYLLVPILQVLVPLGLGMVAGVLIVSKVIGMLLKKHHALTYYAILGLVIGTIFVIIHSNEYIMDGVSLSPVLIVSTTVAFAVGMVVSLVLGKKE